MKVDKSIYVEIQPIQLNLDESVDTLIDQLNHIKATVINPVIYEECAWRDDRQEYWIKGYRLRTDDELAAYRQKQERSKLSAAKRKLSQKERAAANKAEITNLELKELVRLAKKHNIPLPPAKPAPENVMKSEGSQRITPKGQP